MCHRKTQVRGHASVASGLRFFVPLFVRTICYPLIQQRVGDSLFSNFHIEGPSALIPVYSAILYSLTTVTGIFIHL